MSRKLTQIEFEEKVHNIFPDVIVKGEYKGRTQKVLFGCKNNESHIWKNTPDGFFKSRYNGCPFCGYLITRKTHEQFIKQMEEKHPEIEVLGRYERDDYPILVKHKGFDNHIWETTPSNLLKGTSCPYCANKKPLKGFNTFGDYFPELIYLFKNKEDAYKYTYGSGERVTVVCPDCGTERTILLNDLSRNGFSCKVCKDFVSTPNKFIRNIILLKQEILDYFYFEYNPSWVKPINPNFRYDVYFEYNNKSYIIEMNGIQHKTKTWSGKPVKIYDEEKRKLARENNIDYYIEIEADESGLNYLRNNFNQTILKDIFILNEDEWKQVGIKMNKSILVKVCKYFNNNPGIKIKQIAEYFHIHHTTVTRYLLRGNEIGLCRFNKTYTRGKSILVTNLKDNKTFIFSSASKCVKGLKYYYPNIVINRSGINQTLHKERVSYNSFTFQYLHEIDNTYKENRTMKPHSTKIELYKNGEYINTYKSISEASRQTGIAITTFTDWIKGRRKSRQGYTVKVIEQDYL